MIPPYPLAWPDNLPRTPNRIDGAFKTSLTQAVENVEQSLDRFAKDTGKRITGFSFTSNRAGLGSGQPADPGVSIWFEWDGEQRCIAVDRYKRLEHNVQAIHHIIEARRTELRHGGLNIVRQTFKSFVALPAPKSWRRVFGFHPEQPVTKEQIEARFRELATKAHPDKGGSQEAMAELNAARRQALAETSTA